MTPFSSLTDIAAERVVATMHTAQRLREMRTETPRPQLRVVNELVMLITAYLSKRN